MYFIVVLYHGSPFNTCTNCKHYRLSFTAPYISIAKTRGFTAQSDKNTLLEKQANKRSVEKQELNDLRELIFALTNDAGEEKPSQKPNTVFPYHTQKKHVVFGGHPTWLKAIKPMLPDVKFIEGVPSSEQIKGAEMVWLQTNYMSHKAFYKIIDIVRSKNIPLRYFTSASATKGAEQVVVADSGK